MKRFIALMISLMALASPCFGQGYVASQLPQDAFVYAYLPTATGTTITLADTYYEITGPFNNDIIEGFGFVVDHIELTEGPARYFEIDWHTALSASLTPSQTVHVGVLHNSNPVAGIMGTLCKTAGEAYAFSGSTVRWLEPGDSIQLVVSSSAASVTITFNHLHTTIRPFVGGY